MSIAEGLCGVQCTGTLNLLGFESNSFPSYIMQLLLLILDIKGVMAACVFVGLLLGNLRAYGHKW